MNQIICGQLSYSLVKKDSPAPLDAFITFDASLRQITVQAMLMSQVGSNYQYLLYAKLPKKQVAVPLTVTITNKCKNDVVMTESIEDVMYQIGSVEEKTVEVPLWKQTMQECGDLRYQVLVDGSSTMPEFILFDELNRVITI